MDNLSYQQAKDIRGESFGSMMANRLVAGQGIGESFSKTLSLRTQARVKGFKQAFDPLNFARFMTGGSSLGPALLGKMLGRSKSDIKFFAGKTRKGRSTADKLGGILSGEDTELTGILYDIETLLQDSIDEDKSQREKEIQFSEEKEIERRKRHRELIEAITGKPYTGKISQPTTATKQIGDGPSVILDVIEAIGGRTILKVLKSVGSFLVGTPLGIGLTGAAALGAFVGVILPMIRERDKELFPENYKDVPSEIAKDKNITMKAAGEANRQKSLKSMSATYVKELLDAKPGFTDSELIEETGKNRAELQDWLSKNPKGVLKPVEKTKQEVPASTQETETPIVPTTSQESAPPQSTTPAAVIPQSVSTTEIPTIPSITEKLNQVMSENFDAKIAQEIGGELSTIINNVTQSLGGMTKSNKTPLPAVRNDEESLQQMLFNNTRVV